MTVVTAVTPPVAIPDRLRALVRKSEVGIAILAAVVGAIAGLLVAGMEIIAQSLHIVLFGLEPGDRLSGSTHIDPVAALTVPVVGGILLGILGIAIARYSPRRAVDPIEANALHGGRMSVRDSVVVAFQTLISNGFGASVGLEAGFTQIASGFASRLGIAFGLRRADMRVLVGCGAAGAIAAAFAAPLTGAFYAFELIIGTYTAAALAPVLTSAIVAVLVSHMVGAGSYDISVGSLSAFRNADLPHFLLLAIICAGIGILIMRAVTLVELAFRRSRLPTAIQPAIGGLILGGLALVSPQVLSSGHGGLRLTLDATLPALGPVLLVLVLKAAAASISLGSGFRGGLFFASLFLGALAGKLYAIIAFAVMPGLAPDPLVATIIGMTAMAVAVVGGPLTMSFLALEVTRDLPVTLAVIAVAVVSTATVREFFGYSFATWRLHLRGETIRSAHDVGRIRALTVGRLMRRDVRTIRSDAKVSTVRRDFPLGSTQRVVVLDAAERYAGIALIAEIHSLELNGEADTRTIGEFLHYRGEVLEPSMNIKDAMRLFDRSESEALAVVESVSSGKVIGLLTEAHALRRYAEELDRVRRDLIGAGG
ncbi:MAG: chloride channel protein [Rhizobiales bacterium]|nr:chloride channel protein [Hyphomicrobiales bacterium]